MNEWMIYKLKNWWNQIIEARNPQPFRQREIVESREILPNQILDVTVD